MKRSNILKFITLACSFILFFSCGEEINTAGFEPSGDIVLRDVETVSPVLRVSVSSLSVSASGGATSSFVVTANYEYEILKEYSSDPWFTIVSDEAENSYHLEVSENAMTEERTENFIVRLKNYQEYSTVITLTQQGTSSSSAIEKTRYEVNGVEFYMIAVAGGTFQMGSNDSDAYLSEKPVHSVTVSDFSIGQTEVTQGLWKAVMGSNPSNFAKGDNYPVEEVSWNDCQTFLLKLNEQTGKKFRLLTEVEWEYAARGGKNSKGYKYSGSNNIEDVAWCSGNSGSSTHPVGTKKANELGIYDMSGNVYEWCQDWYGSYPNHEPSSGSYRVFRGGSWYFSSGYCRVADRDYCTPSFRGSFLGLRLAL